MACFLLLPLDVIYRDFEAASGGIMNRITPVALAVDSGRAQMFDHISSDGPMWAGNGKRWARTVVRFEAPFQSAPSIHLSISMIDAASARNLRLELTAEDVSTDGFTVVAHTWSDTRIGRLQVQWTAIGGRAEGGEPLWDV